MKILKIEKPIYLYHEHGVPMDLMIFVAEIIHRIAQIAGVKLNIQQLGYWKNDPWLDKDGYLLEQESIEWFLQRGYTPDREQFHAGIIMNSLFGEEVRKKNPHWDVTLMTSDLFDHGCNWVLGCAIPGIGCIFSLYRFAMAYPEEDIADYLESVILHEVGHMFGLPSKDRPNLKQQLGGHCTTPRCIMRQGMSVSEWKKMTEQRLKHASPYCRQCRKELRQYFEDMLNPKPEPKVRGKWIQPEDDDDDFEIISVQKIELPKFRPWNL